jgi:hypothetical protein
MKQTYLLRPFHSKVQYACTIDGQYEYKVLGVDAVNMTAAIQLIEDGKLQVTQFWALKESPLFWCANKPVYENDKLYHPTFGVVFGRFRSYRHESIQCATIVCDSGDHPTIPVSELSWEKKPVKVTRWMNIYQELGCHHYETKESANSAAGSGRIACIEVSWGNE